MIDSAAQDWPAYGRQIGAFLSTPPLVSPHRPVPGAVTYAGQYWNETADEQMAIVSEDGYLFLDDQSRTRLIAGDPDVFEIEGIGAELRFQPGRFELRGRLPGVGTTWTKK